MGSTRVSSRTVLRVALLGLLLFVAAGPQVAEAAKRRTAPRKKKETQGSKKTRAKPPKSEHSQDEDLAEAAKDKIGAGSKTSFEMSSEELHEIADLEKAAKASKKKKGPGPKSTRNLGFVDALFGVHKMDGGSTIMDFIVVPLGLLVSILHLAVVYRMWGRRRSDVALKVKSMTLVGIQSISGVLWYVGFVVRFGHFTRPPSGLMALCVFWNNYVSVVFGFGLWSACILFRLLRLYHFFILNLSEVRVPGLPMVLRFKEDWPKILALLAFPMGFVYGVVLPLFGDCVHKQVGGKYICVYEGRFWVMLDTLTFVGVWIVMFYLVHALRNVNDQFGEYKSIRKALFVSVSCLVSLVFVDVTQIDGLWLGRTLVTTSVLAGVTVFFYTQNRNEVTRVLIGDTTVDSEIQEQVSLAEAGGSDEAILEGGRSPPMTPRETSFDTGSMAAVGAGGYGMHDVHMTPPDSMRQRGARKQQSEFTKAILLD